MYNITAQELHDIVVDDLRKFAKHHNLDISRIGVGDERPLEQTIRLVIWLFAEHEASKAASSTLVQSHSSLPA